MGYTSRPITSNQLTQLVNLNAHGFAVGQVLIYFYNGGAPQWQLAQANSLANCAGTWMVSLVPNANSFYITQEGYIGPVPTPGAPPPAVPFSIGQQYYLSPTVAGELTTTMPTAVGQVILPCFIGDSVANGYFYGGSGTLVQSGALFSWTDINANQNLAANHGYFTTAVDSINLALPAAYAVGDTFRICAHTAGGFVITQVGAATQIFDLGLASNLGNTGTVASSGGIGDAIELVAVVASGALRVVSSKGAFTYA